MTDAAQEGVDPLTRLLAIEDIKMLKSRYFRAVDEKDWAGIAALFTDDARVDFGGEAQYHVGHHGVTDADPSAAVITGGAATASVIEAAVSQVVSVHQGHDPDIRVVASDRAIGRWSLYDQLVYADEVMHGYGHYDEEYRLVDGEWRFSALTLTRLRVVWEPTT